MLYRISILLGIIAQLVWAIPPSLDHLWPFKTERPPYQGPRREIVTSPEGVALAEHEYDAHGRLTKTSYYKNQTKEGEVRYEYEGGKIASELLYNSQGKLLEKLVYTYNKKGDLAGYRVLNENSQEVLRWHFALHGGEIISGERYVGAELTESFRFDSKQKEKQILFDGHGQIQGEIVYVQKDGLLFERTKTDFTGSRKVVYRYDEQKRLAEMSFYRQDRGAWVATKKHEFFY
ncbi:MAG: hypothetical protein NZM25_10535 [Leptospiraceae bacterium]|nr:hypothetical protein [Leptospiraceae bacterium]MDW8305864.1 hypothetical protein [Leptospiraceae bacterium]